MMVAPRHTAVVVCRAHERWICVRHPPFLRSHYFLVGREHIVTTGLDGGVALREKERLSWKVFWNILHILIVVVIADDINRIAFEQVVVGIRLIAACCYRTRRVKRADQFCQTFCQQRVGALFITCAQGGGIMTEIQDEVSLFYRQVLTLSRAPLLQHLISSAPYKNRRMIAVAADEVGQITLKPLIEIHGIVIFRLFLVPHVKSLIHHDKAHLIAHVQQFGGWRVVCHTDCVAAHLF